MKTAKGSLAQALDRPSPEIRFYLFHGPDEGQSRACGERLLKGLGAEKHVVAAQSAKADPALLADEAGAIGLFGGKRALWIEPAGDEIAPSVEALLEVPATESPAIAIAGSLRKTSPLMKLAEAHPAALAHISYELGQRDAEALVAELGRAEGLRVGPEVAGRIAAAAGNDRGIIVQELAKIALYLNPGADSLVEVDPDVLEAIGAGSEGDWSRLSDLALSGDMAALSHELDSSAADAEPISVVRALQRRLLMLAPIRARVEGGERPHDAVTSAGKSVFWKEKDLIVKLVARWDSKALARIFERSGQIERRLMQSDSPPPTEAMEEELIAIARTAQRK